MDGIESITCAYNSFSSLGPFISSTIVISPVFQVEPGYLA